MEELQEIYNELKKMLDKKQQEFISLKSFQNFLIYYPLLNNNKQKAEKLLQEYGSVIKTLNYPINFNTCKEVGKKYVMPIGLLYGIELRFKIQPKLSGVFFWGLQIDFLLLLLGILHRIYYIPITTCLLFGDWSYRKIFYETKNKTYAIKY